MKLQILDCGALAFRCDSCGKILDDADPGEVYFPDYDRFIENVETAGPESVWFLCTQCFAEFQGPAQDWYDDRWKSIIKSDLH